MSFFGRGNPRGQSVIEYRGNLSVLPYIRPSVPPPPCLAQAFFVSDADVVVFVANVFVVIVVVAVVVE